MNDIGSQFSIVVVVFLDPSRNQTITVI